MFLDRKSLPIDQQQLKKRKKNCHGNRKDRRLRKRYREQGMDEVLVVAALEQHKNARYRNPTHQMVTITDLPRQQRQTTVSNLSVMINESAINDNVFMFVLSRL